MTVMARERERYYVQRGTHAVRINKVDSSGSVDNEVRVSGQELVVVIAQTHLDQSNVP